MTTPDPSRDEFTREVPGKSPAGDPSADANTARERARVADLLRRHDAGELTGLPPSVIANMRRAASGEAVGKALAAAPNVAIFPRGVKVAHPDGNAQSVRDALAVQVPDPEVAAQIRQGTWDQLVSSGNGRRGQDFLYSFAELVVDGQVLARIWWRRPGTTDAPPGVPDTDVSPVAPATPGAYHRGPRPRSPRRHRRARTTATANRDGPPPPPPHRVTRSGYPRYGWGRCHPVPDRRAGWDLIGWTWVPPRRPPAPQAGRP